MKPAPVAHSARRRSSRRAAPAARYDLVVLAASAGGIKALTTVLAGLPAGFPAPIAIVQHRGSSLPDHLPKVLGRRTPLLVRRVREAEVMEAGAVYLAPSHLHMMMLPDETVHLFDGRRIRFVRSSANPLMASASQVLGGRVIAVVLTGTGRDATDGVQAVRDSGGVVLAQNQRTAEHFSMPRSAIETGSVARVLPLDQIAPALIELVQGRPPRRGAHVRATARNAIAAIRY